MPGLRHRHVQDPLQPPARLTRGAGAQARDEAPAGRTRPPRSAHRAAWLAALIGIACSGEAIDGPGPPVSELRLALVTDALSQPVHVAAAPGDPDRLFVVEQAGRIRILEAGVLIASPFLDITSRVSCCGERGLLSMAFDPAHAENGRFYVYYTDQSGATRVVRFRVGPDPNAADPTSEELVLGVAQPYANHNGGLVAFGPDGYLYVGLGDGGSAGDPDGNGQNPSTLLGSLLRISVGETAGYAVPADNPFVGHPSARPEIWAYGLRNPWRFSFDRSTGDLYIADVGQARLEEVNVELRTSTGGVNWGWDTMEGTECFGSASCDQSGLTLPVLEYDHGQGCSVIGGHVYRGSDLPDLRGTYFYSDYCSAWIRSFRYQGGEAVDRTDWTGVLDPAGNVTSMGEDARGELYVTTQSGRLYRIAPLAN